jgi:hypothetical protein
LFVVVDLLVVLDVPFLFEDPGDLDFQLGARHLYFAVPRLQAVANSCQHIRDRVGHHNDRASLKRSIGAYLPTRLYQTGNLPRKGELPETQPAHLEFSKKTAGTTTNVASVVLANGELRCSLSFGD